MTKQIVRILLVLWLIVLGLPNVAFAFAEMTTHGYVNCTSCHVSPSGGGVLTEYGRSLSKDLLSMSSSPGEERLFSAVKTPEWLLPGGDVRTIQTYLNNPDVKQAEFFLMQADLAAAIRWAKWTATASVGIRGGPSDSDDRGRVLSRVHYLMYQPSETTTVRAGRFMAQYGLNEPNHTVFTRAPLGFDEEMETYNVEAAWQGDKYDAFLTGIFGRPDDLSLDREKGFALSSSFNLFDKNKIGISAYSGTSDEDRRWLAGFWGILSLAKKVFLLSEVDHQWQTNLSSPDTSTHGAVTYQRLGYEVTQGLQVYGMYELSYLDFDSVSTRTQAIGPGVDFFPRPHLELRGEFLKERTGSAPGYFDYAWLLLHYYF